MKIQGRIVFLLLTLLHVVSSISLSFRGRHQRQNVTTKVDVAALSGTTAWDSAMAVAAGSTSAPHSANDECSAQLGKYWTLPLSDVAVRHNLIPGATVIFEVGGNIGEDLQQYAWKFPSATIFSFEPVPELFQGLQKKFGQWPNVHLTQVGVSNSDRVTSFVVGGKHGEGSSHTNTSAYGTTINVQLRDVHALLTEVQTQTGKVPDVVTINCEGCEYEVLTRMAQMGWLGRIPFVQFSWHSVGGVPNRLGQRCAIEKVLWDYYDPSYHALYGWQGWRLKTSYFFLQEDEMQGTEDIDEDTSDEQGQESEDHLDEDAEDDEKAVEDDVDGQSASESAEDAGEDAGAEDAEDDEDAE